MVIAGLQCQVCSPFVYLLASNGMHVQKFCICVPKMTKALPPIAQIEYGFTSQATLAARAKQHAVACKLHFTRYNR